MKYIIILALGIYAINKVLALVSGQPATKQPVSERKTEDRKNDDEYIDYEEVK